MANMDKRKCLIPLGFKIFILKYPNTQVRWLNHKNEKFQVLVSIWNSYILLSKTDMTTLVNCQYVLKQNISYTPKKIHACVP